ncbi:hypothetical protein PM082_008964 [Marasmius tenuissimus]|nr:hypothetical protein PM082_008964 [Marasmius tenuissimus]
MTRDSQDDVDSTVPAPLLPLGEKKLTGPSERDEREPESMSEPGTEAPVQIDTPSHGTEGNSKITPQVAVTITENRNHNGDNFSASSVGQTTRDTFNYGQGTMPAVAFSGLGRRGSFSSLP